MVQEHGICKNKRLTDMYEAEKPSSHKKYGEVIDRRRGTYRFTYMRWTRISIYISILVVVNEP